MVCVLGIGSRGKVLLAQHKKSSDLYALKVISKRRVLASHEVQRALTEQAVLRRMAINGAYPFVAKLCKSFHDEDNLYLAMVRLGYMYMRLLLSFRRLFSGFLSWRRPSDAAGPLGQFWS
jgi:serine/threonine protein kinase